MELIRRTGRLARAMRRRLCYLVGAWCIVALGSNSITAANFTWSGGGSGASLSDWTKKQNWGGTAAPGAADNALFTNVVGNSSTPTITAASSVNGIIYDLNAALFTIGGASTLTLGAGGIENDGANLQTINAPLSLGAGQIWNANAGSLALGGTLNLQANTLTISGGQSVTHSGVVSGTGGIVRNGAGPLTLSGANTYSGGTTVTSGKLAVNNTSGSGTGSGSVTVNTSGTLAGNGTISGAVTLNAGATISAGSSGNSSIGRLNSGAQTWQGGVTNVVEINNATGAAGTGWDLLNISAGLDLTGASSVNRIYIDVRSLTLADAPGNAANFDPSQSYAWTIVQTGTGLSYAAGQNETTIFQTLLNGFSNPLNGGTFSLQTSGNNLILDFTPAAVPEPSTSALLLLGLAGLGFGRRILRRPARG